MKATINYNDINYEIDLDEAYDISIPLRNGSDNPNAWWATHPVFEPVISGNFIGSTLKGAPVNFYNVKFNPHGNGTHTECVGHISKEGHTINQCLKKFWFKALLISVDPKQLDNGDQVINLEHIKLALKNHRNFDALIIRTLPNEKSKLKRIYGSGNPPYIQNEAMQFIVDSGVRHLLIDLPSVDKEEDKGALQAHHTFWNYPAFGKEVNAAELELVNVNNTITEMIYVPDEIPDGSYILNIQIASFELDASPSKVLLYGLQMLSE